MDLSNLNLKHNHNQKNNNNNFFPSSLMASMLVFHTGDPGSIPGLGNNFHNTSQKKPSIFTARLAHLAERRLSKSKVLSSILKVGTTWFKTKSIIIGDSIMVSIPSCHDGYPGSIPGRRASFLVFFPLFSHFFVTSFLFCFDCCCCCELSCLLADASSSTIIIIITLVIVLADDHDHDDIASSLFSHSQW